MAFRHSCPNVERSGSLKCRPDQPGKGPKKCPGCGASLYVEEGWYGVFAWDGRGHYPAALAIEWGQRETSVQAKCDRLTAKGVPPKAPRGYVVRFIRDRLLPLS